MDQQIPLIITSDFDDQNKLLDAVSLQLDKSRYLQNSKISGFLPPHFSKGDRGGLLNL